MRKYKKIIVRALMLSLAWIIFGTSAYAWLTSIFKSDVPAGFTGGNSKSLGLEIGTVSNGGTETDRIFSEIASGNEEILMLRFSEPEKAADNKYYINLSDMQFGNIDSITVLNPENIVYLRLTIPRILGNNVHFKLYYNNYASGFNLNIYENLYNENNEIIGSENIFEVLPAAEAEGLKNVLNETKQTKGSFLRFQYSLSPLLIANGQMMDQYGVEVLDFSEEYVGFGEYSELDTGEIIETYSGGYNNIEGNDFYYLYVKITPNLESLGYALQHLTEYIPCFITFSVGAQFEILNS